MHFIFSLNCRLTCYDHKAKVNYCKDTLTQVSEQLKITKVLYTYNNTEFHSNYKVDLYVTIQTDTLST